MAAGAGRTSAGGQRGGWVTALAHHWCRQDVVLAGTRGTALNVPENRGAPGVVVIGMAIVLVGWTPLLAVRNAFRFWPFEGSGAEKARPMTDLQVLKEKKRRLGIFLLVLFLVLPFLSVVFVILRK